MTGSPTRGRTAFAAVVTVLALALAGCGASGDDDSSASTTTAAERTTTTASEDTTTTTEGDSTTTAPEGSGSTSTVPESMSARTKKIVIDMYKRMGMTEEQADCAAGFIVDRLGGTNPDLSKLMSLGQDMAKQCNIDPTDLKAPSAGGN